MHEHAVPTSAAVQMLVRGHVQGVGFRPFVFRLARGCGLRGRVRNGNAGVLIELQGTVEAINRFRHRLVSEAPPGAEIDAVVVTAARRGGWRAFAIAPSEVPRQPHVRLPHDLATCAECRREIFDPADRRHHYPFASCTACGPRYSIVEAMPYDRPGTTMRIFDMCPCCAEEYRGADDRRFHAQPNACAECGPQVELWDARGRRTAGPDMAIRAAATALRLGRIVALKGLGGFQLLVRADCGAAVARLRKRKRRPAKPLAVMISDPDVAVQLGHFGAAELGLLTSPRNPIVLVDKRPARSDGPSLAPEVAPRVARVGLLLPTTPLHHLLLSELAVPVVATSGNRTDEPIIVDEGRAVDGLNGIADAFLVHDRPIHRRLDDSVVATIDGCPVAFRLGRGYAPLPLPTLETRAESVAPILATGGHLKSAVAMWTGAQALLAQHIGDLDQPEARIALDSVVRDLTQLYACKPAIIACDLHPDYFTTQWARERRLQMIQVQHHHAHAAACMAEHDLLDREVLAITWDGTGYGPDGTIWGGEILRARAGSFERVASLMPFPLPGGDAAVRHPNRVAWALLLRLLGEDAVMRGHRWQRRLGLAARQARTLAAMIRSGINTPWTSSMGRLFDGVAALVLGIHEVSYEGEAAVCLEAIADPAVAEAYPFALDVSGGIVCMDWRPMLTAILDDLAADVAPEAIAGRFHATLSAWAAAGVAQLPVQDVVLSGGCFRNRLLAEQTLVAVRNGGRRAYSHRHIPPGDGGLAAGQLAVAVAQYPSA